MRAIGRKFFLCIGSLLIALAAAEGALRFAGYALLGLQQMGRPDHTEGAYRILTLGESTTVGWKDTWPQQLQEILNRRVGGNRYFVFNEAVSGITTADIVQDVDRHLDTIQPHIVITMMGINDRLRGISGHGERENWIVDSMQKFKLYKLVQQAHRGLSTAATDIGASYGRLLARWYIIQKRPTEAIDMFLQAIVRSPKATDTETLVSLIRRMGIRYDAESTLSRYTEDNHWFYLDMGMFFEDVLQDNEHAAFLFEKTIEKYPSFYIPHLELARIYIKMGKRLQAAMVRASVERLALGMDEDEYRDFIRRYKKAGGSEGELSRIEKIRNGELFSASMSPIDPVTSFNYRTLSKKLKRRHIKYFAMQYPTLPVEDIKNILNGDGESSDIIFVDNYHNFQKALMQKGYHALFVDRFGDTFGHATKMGNRLIAEAAADQIINWWEQN